MFFVDKGYDEKYGARELKRAMKRNFETLFADFILAKKAAKGDSVTCTVRNKKISFKVKR